MYPFTYGLFIVGFIVSPEWSGLPLQYLLKPLQLHYSQGTVGDIHGGPRSSTDQQAGKIDQDMGV